MKIEYYEVSNNIFFYRNLLNTNADLFISEYLLGKKNI
jgi:hypothetical protein